MKSMLFKCSSSQKSKKLNSPSLSLFKLAKITTKSMSFELFKSFQKNQIHHFLSLQKLSS
eukprot:UN11103